MAQPAQPRHSTLHVLAESLPLLLELAGEESPLTMTELSSRLDATLTALTYHLSRCQEERLVDRDDGRWSLTARARSLLEEPLWRTLEASP